MVNKTVIIMLTGGAVVALGGCLVSKYIENAPGDDAEKAQKIANGISVFFEAVSEFIEVNRHEEIEE